MLIDPEPGQVVELRCLGVSTPSYRKPHVEAGFYDDFEKLAGDAARLDTDQSVTVRGIYLTLNPVSQELLARSANRLRSFDRGESASDTDIVRRINLLVDVDSVRKSGISATDAEHEAALARTRVIHTSLVAEGWPEPLIADSGNGGALVHRIDLPADDGELVRRGLAGLAALFDAPGVQIDTSVFNPARIWRLPGTMNRKGDNIPARPHRLAHVLSMPDRLEPVPRELLEAIALPIQGPSGNGTRHPHEHRAAFDLEGLLARSGLEVTGPEPWQQSGQRWIFDMCPFNSSHTNRSAVLLRFPSGAVAFRCLHKSCLAKGWHELRDLLEPGWRARWHPDNAAQRAGNGQGDGQPNARRAAVGGDPGRFWEGREFRPALLADELMQLDAYIAAPVAEDGVGAFLYSYREGAFQRSEEMASKKAESLLEVRATNARIEDAVKLIRRRVATAHETLNPRGLDLVNVQNGMLDWRTGSLLPHDPTHLSTIRIPVCFDPSATSEIIDRVLRDWFPDDALGLAGEMLGYLLVPTRKHQVAIMLVGEGENGKSTFINLIRSLLGRANVSSETLHDLEENRFRVASLFGKLANLCADIDDRALRFTGVFKKITGDDSLAAERKHQHPFDFDPFARLIFSANTPPAPRNDRTHAFFRRWVVVPFDNSFRDEKKRDRDLLGKITTPEALSALLNIALAGLQRLEVRGGFQLPESVRRAGEKYRREADAVYTFITDECGRGGPDDCVPASELYRSFSAWCEENGYRTIPPKRALEQQLVVLLGAEKDRARVGGRKNPVAVWRGITCSYSPSARGEAGRADPSAEEWP